MARPVSTRFGVTLGYRQKARFDPNYIHRGVDFGCPSGTKVVASKSGKVVHAGRGGMGPAFGIHVVLLVDGIYVIYAHLSRADVKVGQTVSTGQHLGLSGATGNVRGAHLHYAEFTAYHYKSDRRPQFVDVAAAKANTTTAGKPLKAARPRYEVTAKLLNGRGGPGTDYKVLTQRTKGFQFTATRVSGDWVMASRVWYHTGYLKLVDPTKPKPTPAPRPTPKHVEWFPGAFLNFKGDDDEGARTYDARLPKMVTDLTLGLPLMVSGCEVRKGAQANALKAALKAKGYPNFVHADGNFFASRAGNPIEFWDSFILPEKVQGEGRKETLLRVRAKLGGHPLHTGVMHLDYRPGAKFDALRVEQANSIIAAMARMGVKFDMIAPHRTLILGDSNSHTWVRDKAFIPAGYAVVAQHGLDLACIGAHPDRPVLESSSAPTASDHPVLRFTIGKLA